MLWSFQGASKGTQPYMYMLSVLPQVPLPSRLPHNIEQRSLGEGTVKEFGVDRYTLPYLKWKTNEDLLDSRGLVLICTWEEPVTPPWSRGGQRWRWDASNLKQNVLLEHGFAIINRARSLWALFSHICQEYFSLLLLHNFDQLKS